MRVRVAGVVDAAAIEAVRVAGWRTGYAGVVPAAVLDAMSGEPTPRLLSRLSEPGPSCRTFVAEADDRVHGFVNCGPYRHGQRPDRCDPREGGEVYAMYVDPASWRRGVGRSLMERALEHLRRRRLAPVRLWVLRDNPRARRFYERAGFAADGTQCDFTLSDGTPITELRYRRESP